MDWSDLDTWWAQAETARHWLHQFEPQWLRAIPFIVRLSIYYATAMAVFGIAIGFVRAVANFWFELFGEVITGASQHLLFDALDATAPAYVRLQAWVRRLRLTLLTTTFRIREMRQRPAPGFSALGYGDPVPLGLHNSVVRRCFLAPALLMSAILSLVVGLFRELLRHACRT